MTDEEFAAEEAASNDVQDDWAAADAAGEAPEGAAESEEEAEAEQAAGADPADSPDGEGDGEPEEGDGFEEVEIEFTEDDIEAYIVDEDDNEIGFIMLDEEGNEVEYYYTDDEEPEPEEEEEDNPYDLGITREGVAEATSNMNDIYRDGIAIASELKDALTDIQEALDFSDILPGKKKKK